MATKKKAPKKNGLYLFKGADGQWYFHAVRQGRILFASEGYKRKQSALKTLCHLSDLFVSEQGTYHLESKGGGFVLMPL